MFFGQIVDSFANGVVDLVLVFGMEFVQEEFYQVPDFFIWVV